MATPEQRERIVVMWKDSVPLAPDQATPLDWRREFEALCAKFPVAPDIEVEAVDADGVAALRVSAPGVSSDRTIIHFHSGGYCMGSPAGYRDFAYRLSRAADAPVLLPDYRLAPEHLFPAALDDALTAYRWLAAREDPSRIVVCGDSAGGGLTLATLVSLRDAGDALPAAAATISPTVDFAAEGESYANYPDKDPVITRELAIGMGATYMGVGVDPKQTPLASPLYAELHGLPPLFVVVGEWESTYSDATRLVDKVKAAGGEVELLVGEELLHIYPLFASILAEGQEAIERIGRFAQDRTAVGVR